MILIPRAEALARQLHAGQTDKRGRPYVEHLEAVVGEVATHNHQYINDVDGKMAFSVATPFRAIPGSDIVERRYAPARDVLERALEGRGDAD